MANVNVNDLVQSGTMKSTDYMMVFNSTDGARKVVRSDLSAAMQDTQTITVYSPSTDVKPIVLDSGVSGANIDRVRLYKSGRNVQFTGVMSGLNITADTLTTLGTIPIKPKYEMHNMISFGNSSSIGTAMGRMSIDDQGVVKITSTETLSSTTIRFNVNFLTEDQG